MNVNERKDCLSLGFYCWVCECLLEVVKHLNGLFAVCVQKVVCVFKCLWFFFGEGEGCVKVLGMRFLWFNNKLTNKMFDVVTASRNTYRIASITTSFTNISVSSSVES